MIDKFLKEYTAALIEQLKLDTVSFNGTALGKILGKIFFLTNDNDLKKEFLSLLNYNSITEVNKAFNKLLENQQLWDIINNDQELSQALNYIKNNSGLLNEKLYLEEIQKITNQQILITVQDFETAKKLLQTYYATLKQVPVSKVSTALKDLQATKDGTMSFVLLNVHKIKKSLGGDHWVGLISYKLKPGNILYFYIDPMGHPPANQTLAEAQIQDKTVIQPFNYSPVAILKYSLYEPLDAHKNLLECSKSKSIQYVDIDSKGNQNDWGNWEFSEQTRNITNNLSFLIFLMLLTAEFCNKKKDEMQNMKDTKDFLLAFSKYCDIDFSNINIEQSGEIADQLKRSYSSVILNNKQNVTIEDLIKIVIDTIKVVSQKSISIGAQQSFLKIVKQENQFQGQESYKKLKSNYEEQKNEHETQNFRQQKTNIQQQQIQGGGQNQEDSGQINLLPNSETQVQDTKNQIINQEQENKHLKRSEKSTLTEHLGEEFTLRVELYKGLNELQKTVLEAIEKEVLNPEKEISQLKKEVQSWAEKVSLSKSQSPKVEFMAESDHSTDHAKNIDILKEQIEKGTFPKNTVIMLERKELGDNMGMKDIRLLAEIIDHNMKNSNDKTKQIPITKHIIDSNIYRDAELYRLAVGHGVKVIGAEGKGLKDLNGNDISHTQGNKYNKARENAMVQAINDVQRAGYNIIMPVGSAHIDSLTKATNLGQGLSL